ncbi:MAG: hypothetical protein RIQ93_499 [Verrucomicrobiota bacterium]
MKIPTLRPSIPVIVAPWRAVLLVLVTTLVWVGHYDRWTLASWSLPTEYVGDAPEILAQMRAAADGDMWPLRPKIIHRLGAPFGANWNAFPTPDKPVLLMVGALTHLIGLMAAANLGLLLASVTAALSFYFVARWLRCRGEWAWAGSLLFAFTYHTFHRGLGHFSLTFSWTVPVGLLAVWLVAKSRRLEWRSGGAVVCLGSALALGVSNPYNLLFWLQLMGWALIAQWLNRRRRVNLAIGLAAIGVAGVTFIASNIEVWLFVHEPWGAPLIARNYAGTEMYALKPMEMFLPPMAHRWEMAAHFAHRYVRWSEWRGEAILPYLGVVGIAAMLWLLSATLRRVIQGRPLPGQAVAITWLISYATVGGLTNLAALVAGFQIFRATNRVAIFISAIALIFLMIRLTRLTARWPAWISVSLALGVAAVGVLDQVPKAATPAQRTEIAEAVASDRKLARDMEAVLPPGSMVFQLPVLGFPEVTPPHRLATYDLFRPFLLTETLRFSYGAAKHRARSRWQQDVANLPAKALLSRLESYGFAALHISRKGFEDRADRLLKELEDLGCHRRIEGSRGNKVVVLLRPSPNPSLPLGRTLTFGRGWHTRLAEGVRWAHGDAVLSYLNPYAHPITANLRLSLVAVTPREVTLEHLGRPLLSRSVGEQPESFVFPGLVLSPGVNVFVVRSNGPAVRLGAERYQLRSVGLEGSSIKVTSGEAPAVW